LYTSNALNQYSAVGVVARTFDDDGNLTDDGTKQFEWDGENRLIVVKQGAVTVAEYDYDYKSRRISKNVAGIVTSFVYDRWNPIAEFSGTTLSKSYVWGMDLSGSMQGAGGVGGLLAVNEAAAATYYPTMDGNGNISEYIDAMANVVAHYEYDAFGQAVASGTKANDFTHQFSTKLLDAETGLHYYGYRYYDSANGRWPSRDPIEEEGGVNLYAFVGNDSIKAVDFLGLDTILFSDSPGSKKDDTNNDSKLEFKTHLVCWSSGNDYRIVDTIEWGIQRDRKDVNHRMKWIKKPASTGHITVNKALKIKYSPNKRNIQIAGAAFTRWARGAHVDFKGSYDCGCDPNGKDNETLRWVQMATQDGGAPFIDGKGPPRNDFYHYNIGATPAGRVRNDWYRGWYWPYTAGQVVDPRIQDGRAGGRFGGYIMRDRYFVDE
jgi:RHS repeat-associated protein